MPLTQNEVLLRQAKDLAYGLGITFYVYDGGIHQTGPKTGESVEVTPSAGATPDLSQHTSLPPSAGDGAAS
jgi:hypothetical protein